MKVSTGVYLFATSVTLTEVGILMAQEVQPITSSGVAGWSTFGLAGLLLAWLLLKHLPDKDKQIKDLLADHRVALTDKDGQIERMLAAKNRQIEILTTSGNDQIKMMVESNSMQMKLLHEENKASLEKIIRNCEENTRRSDELVTHELERVISELAELNQQMKQYQDFRMKPRIVKDIPPK